MRAVHVLKSKLGQQELPITQCKAVALGNSWPSERELREKRRGLGGVEQETVGEIGWERPVGETERMGLGGGVACWTLLLLL
eukprot:364862-Chlamydomonas_euryale.AAC.6